MARRAALVLIVLLGLSATASAQQRPLCDNADRPQAPVVKLVTMGLGSLIWERHGHIAMCVCGAGPREDRCYNYGIGDFAHPGSMAVGFFGGDKTFWVGRMAPRELLRQYELADRTIWVQPLPLSVEEEQRVIDKLDLDANAPAMHYAYDHFWDNCTTRIRDILDDATGGALSSMREKTDGRTFRDLAREGFTGSRVPLLITDLAMGRVTDRVPTYWERMFLPEFLRDAAETKWGVKPVVLYQRKGPPDPCEPAVACVAATEGPSGRVVFALVILLLTAPVVLARWLGRFQRTGLAIALVPQVLLGTIFWFLAIISPVPYVRWNESCLIFLPLDLLLLFLSPARRVLYARGRVAMLGLLALLFLIGVLEQPIEAALLWPLIPAAVVGFWQERWTRKRAVVEVSATEGKGKGKARTARASAS